MPTGQKLKQLQDIDDEIKYLIYGYNSKIKTTLRPYNLFRNIPFLIQGLCILYYYELMEKFDSFDPNYYKASNDFKTIQNIDGGLKAAFGRLIIPSTKGFNGKWTLRVNGKRNRLNVSIGITSTNATKDTWNPLDCRKKGIYKYIYDAQSVFDKDCTIWYKYGKGFEDGDIIMMHLIIDNIKNKQQLLFSKNGENIPAVIDKIDTGKKIQYRLTVEIGKTQKVTLINFEGGKVY